MILGVMQTVIPYEFDSVKLRSKDTLVLFTDGVTEAMNIRNEEYSDERLENLILNIKDHDADKIQELILNDVFMHTDQADQSDDITTVILKIN